MRRFLLILVTVALAACTTGSGDVVTEARSVGEFSSIEVSGALDVRLTVESGAATAVSVTYDDNLQDKIITEVVGDTLELYQDGNVSTFGGGRFVTIVVDSLDTISVDGASDLNGSGELASYTLITSGASDVDLRGLVAGSVEINVSGASDVTIHASQSVTGEVSGASDVRVEGGPSNARVDTSGASDFDVSG